jgi:nitroimidazol reductase NimA-like FMN-containing flavoprotein (pyridoxamine 5'-phosphate oxidase superfamily)
MIRLCPCGNRLKDNQAKYCSAACTGKYRPVQATGPWKTAGKAKRGLKAFLEGGVHPQEEL